MFEWLSWAILIAAVVIGCGVIAWKIIQVVRMSPEERKKTVKQWLVSAVVAAEGAIKESGAGKEKMAMVLEQFKNKAPILYKFAMAITKDVDLEKLVEETLQNIKDNFEQY